MPLAYLVKWTLCWPAGVACGTADQLADSARGRWQSQ